MTTLDTASAVAALKRIEQRLQTRPARFEQRVQRIKVRFTPAILKNAHTSPRQSALPFTWSLAPSKQQKARAWYFANKVPKGSKGGRYRRTGKTDAQTKVVERMDESGGEWSLVNTSPGAFWLFGGGQVPSHSSSGHPRFEEVGAKWRGLLGEAVATAWLEEGVL